MVGIKGKVQFGDGNDLHLPNMITIRQKFNTCQVQDIAGTIAGEFRNANVAERIKAGMRVAVGVGSRGVCNLQEVVASVVFELRQLGAEPFIIPAMGSHGGATAEGQANVLKKYGITEEKVGAMVVSSMDTEIIGDLNGIPVHCDAHAFNSDAIVLVNRVKPHTDFKGTIESGLAKMAVIGLGKHRGASLWHRQGFDTFHEVIPAAAKVVLDKAPIAFGVALVENASEETAHIELLPSEKILAEEPRLQQMAKHLMPRLLFDRLDVLVVDEIGKDISGAGMDPNITGRTVSGLDEGFSAPPIQKIIVRSLTEKTEGNACGVGVADIITRNLLNQIDFDITYANTITSAVLDGAKIPMVMNSDWDALALALKTSYRITSEHVRIVRIKNTLHLQEIEISESCLEVAEKGAEIEIMSAPFAWTFDENGNLQT